MTDQELKKAIYAVVLNGQHLPIAKQPNSITIEDEFESEGIARVKQCLMELENERSIQGQDLLSAIHRATDFRLDPEDEEPPSLMATSRLTFATCHRAGESTQQ